MVWIALYGVVDIRPILFDMAKPPTHVEMVFQLKTVESFDLADELLVLHGVLDLEWTDHRLNWSGFCPTNIAGCAKNYDVEFERLRLHKFAHLSQIRIDSSAVWTPNVNIYNGDMFDLNLVRENHIPIVVKMDGRMSMKRYVNIAASPRIHKTPLTPINLPEISFVGNYIRWKLTSSEHVVVYRCQGEIKFINP